MIEYKATLRVDEASLVENYLDNQSCECGDLPQLDSGEIDYLAIIESELNWLNASSIRICNLEDE